MDKKTVTKIQYEFAELKRNLEKFEMDIYTNTQILEKIVNSIIFGEKFD